MIISYSRQAEKFLRHAEREVRRRILERIEQLAKDPYDREARRIEGYKERLFRARVGDFRVLFEVDQKNDLLSIVKIDKRERVY